MKKWLYVLMAIFAILIGLYPLLYTVIPETEGFLSTKPLELVQSGIWKLSFYTHISFGALALLIGWVQFSAKIRAKRLTLHRIIGRVYVIAALLSGMAGLYIALFATGGWISSVGFSSLAVIWLFSTSRAFLFIRKGEVMAHRKMMIISYAACLAAVTLRLWMPILIPVFGDYIVAYRIVAWLCWVPNVLVALIMNARLTT